jgi:tryptophan synthase alpha subunit
VARFADAVIVGSAMVRRMGEAGDAGAVEEAAKLTRDLACGLSC